MGPLFVATGMAALVVVGVEPLLWLLILGGGINAIGRSLQTPTLYALISRNSDPKEQGLVFGLNQGLGSIARVIGPAIAAAAYNWHIIAPFGVAGLIVLIASIWTMALHKSPRKMPPRFLCRPNQLRRNRRNLSLSGFCFPTWAIQAQPDSTSGSAGGLAPSSSRPSLSSCSSGPWGTWIDVLVDFGVQLYVPWRLVAGEVLYRDIAHYTGPLSIYYNALAFRVGGVSLLTLVIANLPCSPASSRWSITSR